MDAISVILGLTAGALGVVALSLWMRHRRLEAAVGEAVTKLGSPNGAVSSPRHRLTQAVAALDTRLAELEARHDQYLDAINGADLGIVLADRVGRVVLVNPRAERYVNARLGDAVAEVRFRAMVGAAIRTGHVQEREFDVYTPERRVLRLHAIPLQKATEIDGAILYLDDLTARRRVDQMRQDFVANASHELKTPIGALLVLAETIADTDDLDVRRKLTERLGDEAQRMSRLVDDILSLSHLESTETRMRPLPIADVVRDAHDRVAVTAESRGVDVEGAMPDDDLTVLGDHDQLVSAVANLLDNAVKYTKVIDGEPASVRWSCFTDGDDVVIEVDDDGIGMSQVHLGRIFERFYRVDRGRSRDTGGTGLGLSIVRHVALNHGGDVSVESELGKGSTFRLRLPRAEAVVE